jgi:hypothetical protein
MATEIPPTELMRLYDNYEAPLSGGSYRFVLQQSVTLEGDKPRHYYRDQKFEVVAPRYAIEPDEVHAFFPPPGAAAEYENVLPHLVLRTRNLPWERTLAGREPWLALLVLSEQDLRDGRVAAKTGKVADLQPDPATLEPATRKEQGETIFVPKFTHTEDANTPVRLLDMDLKHFLKVCPRREELPLLAHIRHVDIGDKVPLEMVAAGEFAVIVGNRFPQVGPNTVHLISLEGWDRILNASSTQSFIATRLRLITLANWSFVCDSKGDHSFAGLMQQLRKNAAQYGVKLPAASASKYVNEALAKGYAPLDYRPRDSSPAFAWYRGPLAPLAQQPMKQPAFQRADAALVFDKETGVMNVSYAAAWELGRLLALGSPAFTKGLRLFVESSQNASEFARQIKNFLELHRSAFGGSGSVPEPKDEAVAITEDLVDWLARLVLLYPVPLHYLVPHPLLLPPESVRFFHLDDNWVDALVDGALSIAVSALNGKDLAARADLQATLSKIVYQHRLRLLGKSPEWNPLERYMDTPKSGFLLRSSIVTGWPGIEVTVKTNAAASQTLPQILRYDRVSDGVLFCLARGWIEQLVIREPREGLSFGVTSTGEIESGTPVNVKRDLKRRDALAGVTDILELRNKLSCTGSAQLAVKMMRKPEEQVIAWKEEN